MNNDYSMFRYYKGETKNPFEEGKGDAYLWWDYEKKFEDDYIKNDASDWNAFFDYEYNPKYWNILNGETSDEKPNNKRALFSLWLDMLIVEHLCEYSSPDVYYNSYNNSVKV